MALASEYLKWKYRDVRPDEPVERTKKQKAANWWHYHKWPLLIGALLLIAAVDIGWNALGIGKIEPDYQFAYVASLPLSDETVAALEKSLAAYGEDCNGDGRVVVKVQTYVDMAVSRESEAAQYAAAAQVRLMADLENCESYFFILDHPETLHENYQILSREDGALAEYADQACWYAWESCPALTALDADQTALEGLSIARRGFWEDRTCRYREQCDELWRVLTEGAKS